MPADAVHTELQSLVTLIHELSARASHAESVSELFTQAFPALFDCVPFDCAVAVMLEQHLDLYVTTRPSAQTLMTAELVARIRRTLETLIPVSFAGTDVIVRSECHDLPEGNVWPDDLRWDTFALLKQENRTAGLLLLVRKDPPFTPHDGQILEIFSTQISMLLGMIRAREKIVNLADTDDLTGIWNKRYFRRQLPQEIERARTFNLALSLLLFDIDEFKQINDGFGHVIGDVVLSELCGVVRETLRPPDIIARFGGDEFAVILPHTDTGGACAVAERILRKVSAVTIPTDDEGAIRCSISIGVAEFARDAETAHDLIRRADERLYESKRSGKNRYTA
jgi:diguanylate cyclase (GGDEF)-like protein